MGGECKELLGDMLYLTFHIKPLHSDFLNINLHVQLGNAVEQQWQKKKKNLKLREGDYLHMCTYLSLAR